MNNRYGGSRSSGTGYSSNNYSNRQDIKVEVMPLSILIKKGQKKAIIAVTNIHAPIAW
jgi:hypothetical protein